MISISNGGPILNGSDAGRSANAPKAASFPFRRVHGFPADLSTDRRTSPRVAPRPRARTSGEERHSHLPHVLIDRRCNPCLMRRFLFLLALVLAACDHGLAPPPEPPTGVIVADIEYLGHPDSWPSGDSLDDLRFVAMRIIPRDTTDLLDFTNLVFSEGLLRGVAAQSVTVSNVETGLFLYSGVAQKYGPDVFDWRPVGLVEENGGVFEVVAGETTRVSVTVDFRNPPPFPPEP